MGGELSLRGRWDMQVGGYEVHAELPGGDRPEEIDLGASEREFRQRVYLSFHACFSSTGVLFLFPVGTP